MKSRAVALAALPPYGPAAKLQLALDSVLAAELDAYRQAYAEEHQQEITLDQLAPAILKAFLQRDRGFQRWKKARGAFLDAREPLTEAKTRNTPPSDGGINGIDRTSTPSEDIDSRNATV